HRGDAELLAFASEAQRFRGSFEIRSNGEQLVAEGLHAGQSLDDLSGDFVRKFGGCQFRDLQARLARSRTSGIEQPARTDPPAQSQGIVFRSAESARPAILVTPKAADKGLGAEAR